ncbi:MAG: hypothetical protein ACK5RE_18020 [Pseudanabaena sp.]|jgi:hypothetical protein
MLFSPALLPTGVNEITTVEQLKVWCDMLLADQIGSKQLTRVEGEKLISVCARTWYRDKDGLERMEVFSHMRMLPNWETIDPTTQPWKKAVVMAETSIPASFSD